MDSQDDINYFIKELELHEDFPKKGVKFIDIMPIFKNKRCLHILIEQFKSFIPRNTNVIIAPELRGCLIATYVSFALDLPLVVARKPKKLPGKLITAEYKTEYSVDQLQIKDGALKKDDNVFIIDDVMATGGTLRALLSIIEQIESTCTGIGVITRIDKFSTDDITVPVYKMF